jgi:hypothetical protein
MRNPFPAMICIVLLGFGSQAAPQQPAGSDLKSRADAAQGGERVTLSLDYARQQLELANKLYSDGDVEKAEGAIGEVLAYSERATTAATTANKKLKQTEIDLRKLEHRMRDIGQSLNIDDRPPVEKTVQELEDLRADLLAKMFGPKAQPKDKSQ